MKDIIISPTTDPDLLLETARIYIESQENDFPFLPRSYTHGRNLQAEVRESIEWLESNPENRVFVAMDGAHMAGYAAASRNTGPLSEYEGEINNLYVRKAYRGCGIGLLLMRAAAGYLLEIGCQRLLVYTLAEGESDRFYRHVGGVLLQQITQWFAGEPLMVDIFGYEISALLAPEHAGRFLNQDKQDT